MMKQGAAMEARIAMNKFREEMARELSIVTNGNADATTANPPESAILQGNDDMNDILMENSSNGMIYTQALPQDLD